MEEVLENILKIWGLGFLGIIIYGVITVWKKIKSDGFSAKKFFGENIQFWIVCVVLNLLFSVLIIVVPESKDVLHSLGFAIEENTKSGFVLLGIALAIGSDKSGVTGVKTLISKK